jgi:hypothetical protein
MLPLTTKRDGLKLSTLNLLLGLIPGCVHGVHEDPPLRPTWERFQQEMHRSGDQRLSEQYSKKCQRSVFHAFVDAYEGATCSSSSDCSVMIAWPVFGPCCVAVGADWSARGAYLKHENPLAEACGYVDRLCPDVTCEVVCVSGKCKIKGQNSLLPSSSSQQPCEKRGVQEE